MRPVRQGVIRRWIVTGALALGVIATSGIGTLALSPAPPGSEAPASPCPSVGCPVSPAPFAWPLVQFLGGRAVPVVSSTCGVPGVDTFHLVATDGYEVDEFDVVLAPWDPSFMGVGWPGSASGTRTGGGYTTPCFETAGAVYDPSTGVFELAACASVSVPMSAC